MFFFDIVEQMFVRNMPELANYLRDQLREAVTGNRCRQLPGKSLQTLKKIACPDRADGLSERLAMMFRLGDDRSVPS